MWSAGCILGEIFQSKALFRGIEVSPSSLGYESEQMKAICSILGNPSGSY